jgi:cell volume regulation protein A
MEFGNALILVSAGLILLSIFAGTASARVGAPLLLVFLALGMLAGEDGPGGLEFDDFQAAYVIGATSLAIVLFDGGLRTRVDTLKTAGGPALLLATLGVAITAGVVGAAAHWLMDLTWIEGLLVGSIVASTDAAAVFFLLNIGDIRLGRRVRATLEVESGMNDPMAVFLAITCIELIQAGATTLEWPQIVPFTIGFLSQMVGGTVIGLAGGYALVGLINRMKLDPGLYPILALAGALLIYSGSHFLHASGFLAVFLAGVVVGNRRHRARQVIDRFQDGIAWLSQIVMFVMLGLLVTPRDLLESLVPALLISAILIFLARPLAVVLCLLPFRFSRREHAFISWVGLRGAVPIFIGAMPVLAGVEGARAYFDVAFVVVLTSLIVQGWTIAPAAHFLKLALPARAGPPVRRDIDLPEDVGRDMAAFSVQEESLSTKIRATDIRERAGVEFVAVIRDGAILQPDSVWRFLPGDQVLVLGGENSAAKLEAIFGTTQETELSEAEASVLGEFSFDPAIRMADLAEMYEFPIPTNDRDLTADEFLRRHRRRKPEAGDRYRLGPIELVVQAIEDGKITRIGIELDPEGASPLSRDNLRLWLRHVAERWRPALRRATRSAKN